MNQNSKPNPDYIECKHENVIQEGGYVVCKDCGLIVSENPEFEEPQLSSFYSDSQREYERRIRSKDRKAKQNPKVKEHYDKIKTLEKWFRDYKSSFTTQKHTIELLKGYGIGHNIDQVKYQEIKERYLRYNKYHRKTYQNMVIIFLAIVWMEIKDTTNVRIEEFIEVCQELGHKINKKMLNNAMLKVKKTEKKWKRFKTEEDLEKEIKNKVKILFQKDLNSIPFKEIKKTIPDKSEFHQLKIEMTLLADRILNHIRYAHLRNLNYKAFTAGLIYYIGQTLDKEYKKIFTQSLVEEISKFSSTTIRKKYNILKSILGDPNE